MSDNNHKVFTAIPYDGFEALLGTGDTSISSTGRGGWFANLSWPDWTCPRCDCHCSLDLSDRRKEQLKTAALILLVILLTLLLSVALGVAVAAIIQSAKHHHHQHHHHHNTSEYQQYPPLYSPNDGGNRANGEDTAFRHHSKGDRPNRRHSDQPRLRKNLVRTVKKQQRLTVDENFFPLDDQEEEWSQNFFPMGDDTHWDDWDTGDGADDYEIADDDDFVPLESE